MECPGGCSWSHHRECMSGPGWACQRCANGPLERMKTGWMVAQKMEAQLRVWGRPTSTDDHPTAQDFAAMAAAANAQPQPDTEEDEEDEEDERREMELALCECGHRCGERDSSEG